MFKFRKNVRFNIKNILHKEFEKNKKTDFIIEKENFGHFLTPKDLKSLNIGFNDKQLLFLEDIDVFPKRFYFSPTVWLWLDTEVYEFIGVELIEFNGGANA